MSFGKAVRNQTIRLKWQACGPTRDRSLKQAAAGGARTKKGFRDTPPRGWFARLFCGAGAVPAQPPYRPRYGDQLANRPAAPAS